jgi:hypothetical protein
MPAQHSPQINAPAYQYKVPNLSVGLNSDVKERRVCYGGYKNYFTL